AERGHIAPFQGGISRSHEATGLFETVGVSRSGDERCRDAEHVLPGLEQVVACPAPSLARDADPDQCGRLTRIPGHVRLIGPESRGTQPVSHWCCLQLAPCAEYRVADLLVGG